MVQIQSRKSKYGGIPLPGGKLRCSLPLAIAGFLTLVLLTALWLIASALEAHHNRPRNAAASKWAHLKEQQKQFHAGSTLQMNELVRPNNDKDDKEGSTPQKSGKLHHNVLQAGGAEAGAEGGKASTAEATEKEPDKRDLAVAAAEAIVGKKKTADLLKSRKAAAGRKVANSLQKLLRKAAVVTDHDHGNQKYHADKLPVPKKKHGFHASHAEELLTKAEENRASPILNAIRRETKEEDELFKHGGFHPVKHARHHGTHLESQTCAYKSLADLTPDERHPKAGSRHMVTPPADTTISLVCCHTTAGPWTVAVHHAWAPHGAQRFLDMVKANYFSTPPATVDTLPPPKHQDDNKHKGKEPSAGAAATAAPVKKGPVPGGVPLMRCVQNFLCQFGLAGPASRNYASSLPDDPNWLPEGPEHRKTEAGVKRFAKGYFAYAGAGKQSRTQQLIVALGDNERLAGGSPWEVPWGELVGKDSFQTLDQIYTGYGEHGPKQGLLHRPEALETVARDFPFLDHIRSCKVIDEAKDS